MMSERLLLLTECLNECKARIADSFGDYEPGNHGVVDAYINDLESEIEMISSSL